MNNVLDVLSTGYTGEDTELNIPEGFVLTKQEALELRDFNGKFCITSLYLLEEINKLRIREGKSEMRHTELLRTIVKEFENGKINERLTASVYLDSKNEKRKMYLLPERELEYILGYLSGTFRKEMVDSFRFLRVHFQELLLQEKEKLLKEQSKLLEDKNKLLENKEKLLEDKDKENNQLKEKVEKLKVEVKKKKQRFNDYGMKDHATVSRFLEEIGEFSYKNRDKLFTILFNEGVIYYIKQTTFKSILNKDNPIGTYAPLKYDNSSTQINVFNKKELYRLWFKFKDNTIPLNFSTNKEIIKKS